MALGGGLLKDLAKRAQLAGASSNVRKAAVAVAVALAVIALARWVPAQAGTEFEISGSSGQSQTQQADEDAGSGDTPGDAGSAATQDTAGSSTRLVVHVAGQVASPGVYRVDAGSRVIDAIEAAGGLAPDADQSRVNLARPLNDGEQVFIPSTADSAGTGGVAGTGAGTGGGNAGAGGAGLVNINTASSDELQALPGIGPSTAAAIIAYRTDVGPFSSIDDIQNVSGIGEAKFAKIQALICV